MDARLQRRVQRYGWDLAAASYERCWQKALAPAQAELLRLAGLQPGHRVLDVACGTGLVSLQAADRVGASGDVLGVDLSVRMIEAACDRAAALGIAQAHFACMDAESLELADDSVDVALCALGLMYMPDPKRAVSEMTRVLKPGGRLVIAVWGERERCGWSALFPIVDAVVASDVCPLFFRLGTADALAQTCRDVGLIDVETKRLDAPFEHADSTEAIEAAFCAGPVSLAWSRLGEQSRQRVAHDYLAAMARYKQDDGYRIDGEFVVVAASRPSFAAGGGQLGQGARP